MSSFSKRLIETVKCEIYKNVLNKYLWFRKLEIIAENANVNKQGIPFRPFNVWIFKCMEDMYGPSYRIQVFNYYYFHVSFNYIHKTIYKNLKSLGKMIFFFYWLTFKAY